MIKILQITSTISISRGDFMVPMNYYRNLDHEKITFDFAYINECENNAYEEIKSYGGKSFKFTKPELKTFKQTIKDLRNIIINGDYDIIHLHVPIFQNFIKRAMKKTNCKNLIIHAHSSKLSTEFLYILRNKLFISNINKNLSARFACTQSAGKAWFGGNFSRSEDDYIINNAIDLDKFRFDNKSKFI